MAFSKLVSVFLLLVCCTQGNSLWAQKAFSEGRLHYKVTLQTPGSDDINGTLVITSKGGRIRKDLALDNGFRNTVIVNCMASTAYTLKTVKGKNYAIQMKYTEMVAKQSKYKPLQLQRTSETTTIGGLQAQSGVVHYPDGQAANIYYNEDWYPEQGITFDRFPDAHFLPVDYTLKTENGSELVIKLSKVVVAPIEEALFRVPTDYKIVAADELREMTK